MLKLLLFTSAIFFCNLSQTKNRDTVAVQGINPSAVAIKNGFPMPAQVLKYQQELLLTATQISRLKEIDKTLALKKIETSISNSRNEQMLDSMFKTRKLNEGSIIFYTNRYGLYEGEYRGAVLVACYDTRMLLTAAQLAKFIRLQKP